MFVLPRRWCWRGQEKLAGEIDSSILVVLGVHARLEDISESGRWVRTVRFELGGEETVYQEGQSVGNVMLSWRRLRTAQPDLFRNVKVCQNPTSFVDAVVFSWQQEAESARYENLLRLVDSLKMHWADQAAERNYLGNALQACVPPGCAPLSQVTDTGLAMPRKAACRDEHARQRYLLKLKAREEATKAVLKVGCREICRAATEVSRPQQDCTGCPGRKQGLWLVPLPARQRRLAPPGRPGSLGQEAH